jgi:hypothetical protein
LLQERRHVGQVRLWQAREVGRRRVHDLGVGGIDRESNEASLEEPRMRLGEIVVVADDHGGAVEEVHGVVGIMAPQPRTDAIGLPDVGDRSTEPVRVGARSGCKRRLGSLSPFDKVSETVPGRAEHFPGPVHDLGDHQAGGVAVGEKEGDRAG